MSGGSGLPAADGSGLADPVRADCRHLPEQTGEVIARLMTNLQPGGVAIIQLHGEDVSCILEQYCGPRDWSPGRLSLVSLGKRDHGLAVLVNRQAAQLMPHGGVRLVEQILSDLEALGLTIGGAVSPRLLYPEADSMLEAAMLSALSEVTGTLAADWLLAQPRLWQEAIDRGIGAGEPARLAAEAGILNQLLHPPMVALVGAPNAGKSTLANQLVGRTAAVVSDQPGTTRDWVRSTAMIPVSAEPEFVGEKGAGAIAIHLVDTAGWRRTDDPVEAKAMELGRAVVEQAALQIHLREPDGAWVGDAFAGHGRALWVINKADLVEDAEIFQEAERAEPAFGSSPDHPLWISAVTGQGMDHLYQAIVRSLGLECLRRPPGLWAFCPELLAAASEGELAGWLGRLDS